MGTRADFYTENEKDIFTWIGSVCWDGYDIHEFDKDPVCVAVKEASTKAGFLKAMKAYAGNRTDWVSPDQGWPWPWVDSHTTDMSYVFSIDNKVDIYSWGKTVEGMNDEGEYADGEPAADDRFPDMTDVQNVGDAGFIVLTGTA